MEISRITGRGNISLRFPGKSYIIGNNNSKEDGKITIKQKVEVACSMADITLTELGKRMGMSQANFSKRLKVGKFTQDEMEEMGKALGAEWKSGFYFPDGNKVE